MANFILFIYTITTSAGLILLKLGSKAGSPVSFAQNKLHFNLNLFVLGGIFLYGFSFLIYTYLISKNDLGYIVPVSTALVYIFIFSASYVIFKETFNVMRVVGILLVFSGIVILNLGK